MDEALQTRTLNAIAQIISCTLLISNSMISRSIWKKHALVGFSNATNITRPLDSCYFEVFEKLTCACFFPNCTRNRAITYTKRFSLQSFAAVI